jgi:hypothetical protein
VKDVKLMSLDQALVDLGQIDHHTIGHACPRAHQRDRRIVIGLSPG